MSIVIKVTLTEEIEEDVRAEIALTRTVPDGEDLDDAAARLRVKAAAMVRPPAPPAPPVEGAPG